MPSRSPVISDLEPAERQQLLELLGKVLAGAARVAQASRSLSKAAGSGPPTGIDPEMAPTRPDGPGGSA